MAATVDDIPQSQSALTEKVEPEERELLTSSSTAIEELQVEKKVQTLTEVEITNESITGISEKRDDEQFSISPILIEIDGEKNSSSSQLHNGKDMTNGVKREESKTHLTAEEGLQSQEVEITGAVVQEKQPSAEESRDLNKDGAICVVQDDTIMATQEATSAQTTGIEDHLQATQDITQEVGITVTGASVPGTQLNVEESRDLNKDEAICGVQEDTIMELQETASAQTTGIEDHLDATQDINLEIVKLLVTGNQGADQQNTSNTATASFQDPHEVGLQMEKEADSAISSNLDIKKMEPQELNSSQKVEDETTEEVQMSLALTRDFPYHTEMGKEESQDTEALAQTVHLEDEPAEKIDLLREVSTETESKGSRCNETRRKNPQDAELHPFSVLVRYESTKEVENLSEHTGNVSPETKCAKDNRETSEGNPQDAERVIQSTDIDNETTKKVEISPDLAENVSIGMETVPDNCEMIKGKFEDHTTSLHSAILEDETTEKVESLSEPTNIVSIETGCCSDPTKMSEANAQDTENFFHSVDVQDENIEEAGNSPDGSNYIEATKEEISDDVEMNTLGAEPGEISCEVKSTDDGKEKEILESERSDLASANVAISSTGNYPNKSEKEEVENSSHEEQVSSPMISAFTEEILLKDIGPEKVQDIEAHSGTIFEKEEAETEHTSEPALVKEVPDTVPILAKENQAEVEKQNMFLEDIATENSTESAMGKAKETPVSTSNDLVIEKAETLGIESQEQVPVELLAGEGIHDEVSKGLTEINIEVEVPVKPEISNTKKDLEAFLPENEPGKYNRKEFLQEASERLEKIDSCQHSERMISVQDQRSTELLEGDLCEEKDSTNNASKSKADNSLQENTMADGSNKEADNADPNNTAQETYETEETQYNESEEGASQSKEDQIVAEVVYKDFAKDEEKEMQIIDKDELTKEYLIEASVAAKNKSDHQEMNHEADDIQEGEAVYRNDDKDIKGNDSVEGPLELKEDQISAKQEIQVDRDTSEKDEKKERQIIDEEEVDTALESSFKEEKLSDYGVTSEITNPEADEANQIEIEGNSEEEAPEPKEYQIAAGEKTFNKDDKEIKQIIDEQEMATESLIESSVTEENKLHYELETEPINPEADDIRKQEAFFSNDDEKMKGHIEERAADLKEDQITAGEVTQAHKDIFNNEEKEGAQLIDKEVAVTKYLVEEEKSNHEVTTEVKNTEADEFHEGNEEIKGNDSGVTKPEDQIEEVHKDTFSKDEKEMKIMDKEEVSIDNSVEASVAKEHNSGHKVMAEETITEADELLKTKSDHIKDDEDPKGNYYSEEEVPEPNDHIAAKEIHKETFSMDEVKEAQMIDKEEVATENMEELTGEEDNKSSHEVSEKATLPEVDDVHKVEAVCRNGDERETGLIKDQILDEEACQDTFSKDENKDTKIKGKVVAAIEYLGESHAANLNKSDYEITTTATYQGDEEEKIIGNHPKEIAAELKVDQIAAEEVMQAQKDKICKDAEKETQIIGEQEVSTKYSVDSSAADFNKCDDKEKNPKADDVDKQEAVYRNNDEKIKGIDSEKGALEQTYQILSEEACKEEEDADIIEKREVAIEYSVESIVVEENMSSHMDKVEVTNPDSDELHKGKADHPNEREATQGNDPEKVATELNEDHMADKEAYEDMSSKEDREKVLTECLVESSVAETEKSYHKVKEETNQEVSDIHYGAENLDPLEETTSQNELQDPFSEDIIADKILTSVPSLEVDYTKLKEEFEPERHFATSSAEEMKAEANCEESQLSELNREGERLVEESLIKEKPDVMEPETETKDVDTIENDEAAYTAQEEEKVKAKNEGNAGVSAGTDRLAEGLSPQEYQEQPENSNATPVQGSLKKEEQYVLESHELGTNNAGMESIVNNDEVTHAAQGREIDIVMQGNAEALAEGLPPGEYQEQVANFITAPENSEQRKEDMLETKVPIEIRLFEGSLKQEECDSMEPRKEKKDLDTAGTTENNDTALITQKCGRGNPEAASHTTLVPDISEETKRIMIDTTESAEVTALEKTLKQQEEWVITEQEKETRDLHVECITEEDDAKHTAESSSRMTDASEEWNEKTLDTKMLTETRQVEETLEQKERVVMEQEIETKDLLIEVTTKNDKGSHSTEEGEKMMLKHEENINVAGTSKIAEELPPREYQEQLGNSSEVPEDSKKSREKKPSTMEQVVIRSVERSTKQDEWDVLEPEKEIKDADIEGKIKNDEATYSIQEAEMKNIMHEANADAAKGTEDSTILTEALPPTEYQGVAENLNPAPKISEQSKEKILDTTVSTEIRLVEVNMKQEDWDVLRPEKEENNLDREDTVQTDKATLSVKGAEKDTIKQGGHPEDAGTDTLGEELIARKHQELAKTSSEVPDILKQRNEKMLDTKESTEVRPVEETLKQEEQVVMEQENYAKYSHVERTTENNEAINTAQEGQKGTVKNERNLEAADTHGLMEGLAATEYQEFTETSVVVSNISKEINETVIDSIRTKEIKLVKGVSKQMEWEVMGPEKETKDLDGKDTIKKDEVTLAAKQGEECMVEHVRNPDASGTEKLPPREYYEELAEHYSVTVSKVAEVRNDKLLDATEKEKDGATFFAKASQKDTIKSEANPDDAATSGLTDELPTRECEELAGNSRMLPDISMERNEKLLETTESTEINSVEGILKKKEWEVKGQEKETKDLREVRTRNNDAMHSAKDGENVVRNEENANVADKNRVGEELIPREYQELAENSSVLPDNSDTSKDKMSEITESTEIIQAEISKQEEWYVIEPEKKIKDLDKGTALKDKATISAQEGGKESSNYVRNPHAEGLPPREYKELEENFSAGEEWDAIESEKETKDLKSTTQKDKTTLPVAESEKETIKHERNQDAAGTNTLTEGFPPEGYQELYENSSVVAETSEERDKKLVDAIGSTVMNPIEGISKQGKWNIEEPEKETKDCHIEETTQNDHVTHFAQEVRNMEIKHQGNANAAGMDRVAEEFPQREYQEHVENFIGVPDISEEGNEKMIEITESKVILPVEGSSKQDEWDVSESQKIKDADIEDTIIDKGATHLALEGEKITVECEGDTISTFIVSEELSQREHGELAENSNAMPEVSDKSKQKMLDNLEPTEIAVQVQENLHLDNNTPTPEKVDQEDAPKQEVQPRSNTVDSQSGNTITEVKILNEMDKCSKVPSTETDEECHAQENIDRKDTEVNSSSASTASLVDVTVIESPEQLKESMVSEDKPVQARNEKNEDDKKDEAVTKVDTITLSLLEQETPPCSPNESTCNILKKHKIMNLEEQDNNTENASSLLTGTSEHEQINAMEKTEQNHLRLETGSTQEVKAKAQGSSSRDDEKQQIVETVPLKMEKLEITELQKSIPEKVDSTKRKNVSQLQHKIITRNSDAVGENPEQSEEKPEVEAHWEEEGEHEEATLASMPRDTSPHDLLQTSKKEEVRDIETERAQNEEPDSDEEGEGDEDKRKESAYESPVTVEAPSDIDVKAAQKKSHNILSGVGSKVKQSIKKVKRAITGKSSRPKPSSPK